MNTRTVADVESWDRRSADGGLEVAADRGFSGAVRAGESYCFVVAGRPVGVFDYREDPSGDPTVTPTDVDAVSAPDEAFVAPHDALPLLYAMQATGGETRGRYYSNDTPLVEVDRTLQDGGFTGYIDLSENVLSGDYYLVYHGGRRRTVAFVGQSRRLKTDEEAFDLAADEVGIYTVERVSLPNLSFPEDVAASGGSGSGAAAGAAGAAGAASARSTASSPDPDPVGETTPNDGAEVADSSTATRSEPASEQAAESSASTSSDIDIDITPRSRREAEAAEAERAESSAEQSGVEPEPALDSTAGPDIPQDAPVGDPSESESQGADGAEAAGTVDEPTSSDASSDAGDAVPAIVRVAESEDGRPAEASQSVTHEASQEAVAEATAAVDVEEETAATEADSVPSEAIDSDHVVPSVDPERTGRSDAGAAGNGTSSDGTDAGTATADSPVETTVDTLIDGETVAGLRSELSERDAELAEREAELDEMRERLATAESEKEGLRERIAELEGRLEAAGAAPESAGRTLSPAEALEGTSLFVRYRSKRDPTLSDLVDGAAANEVADNLRLEHHTQFPVDDVSVDGRSFDAFLESTQAYEFVTWLVQSLPYEIRDTGNADALEALYAALPSIDRIEFDGEVDADGGTVTFDLVCRDRMGQPLVVANLEDVREPTDEVTLGTLVTDTTAVSERHESLAGSFAVTSAYFEPAALETASEATSGSLLSRSKRKSFVKLSRNQGFHLALVEDRDESFYVSVPEL